MGNYWLGDAPKSKLYVKIPMERVGVLIGEKGSIKKQIEEATATKLNIDSKTGGVEITQDPSAPDPAGILKARDLVLAIGRGFSPQRAFRLLEEGQLLEIIDLKQYVGDSKNALIRVKGRIIGENGKARRTIEEYSGAYISVYGHTVSIIGDYDQARIAREAIEMLIRGAQHGTVYRFLEKARRELKRRMLQPPSFLPEDLL